MLAHLVRPPYRALRVKDEIGAVVPKPISYGVIGCGMMGQEHLRNIALVPDAVISAIY